MEPNPIAPIPEDRSLPPDSFPPETLASPQPELPQAALPQIPGPLEQFRQQQQFMLMGQVRALQVTCLLTVNEMDPTVKEWLRRKFVDLAELYED